MTNTLNGLKVKAVDSFCPFLIPCINTKYGTVVKTNKKSIRVKFNHIIRTSGSKVTDDRDIDGSALFTFWKTIVKEDGTIVDLFRNQLDGIIEITK